VNLIAGFRGQAHRYVGWTASLTTESGPNLPNKVEVLDLIGKLDLNPLFNLWVGRMLPAVDRSALSGPWGLGVWNFPGFYGNRPGAPLGHKTKQYGRDNGATAWGQVAGGRFKYYLGAFSLENSSTSPIFSARVVANLFDPEPGYFNRSTYFGEKNILAIGAGVQRQKDGSVLRGPAPAPGMPAPVISMGDLAVETVDVLFEKVLGTAGSVTLEGAFFRFDDNQGAKNHAFGLVGYLLPWNVWIGKLYPAVRMQRGTLRDDSVITQLDTSVGFLVEKHAIKVLAGYARADLGDRVTNAVQIGLQLQR
jgi:hypothetical protein